MSASESSKQSAVSKPFSSTVVVNFLNNYYRNVAMKKRDDKNFQSISFKTFNEKKELDRIEENKKLEPEKQKESKQLPFTIDLADYEGLGAFVETCKKWHDKNFKDVIEATFDMRLRGCLDVAKIYKTNDPKLQNAFEVVIAQLGFDKSNMMRIDDYIKGVSSFFENTDKLKTKIFNSTFPHDSHDAELDPSGVNVIYLQHVSVFHDEVLDLLINKHLSESDILGEVQKLFAKSFVEQNRVSEPEAQAKLQRLVQQLMNTKLIDIVLNPPAVETKKREIIDPKWLEDLRVVEKKGRKLVETEELLTTEEKKAVKSLLRELFIVKSFIKIVQGGQNARELVLDEDGKLILTGEVERKGKKVQVHQTKPVNADLSECLQHYKETYELVTKFYNDWKKQIERAKSFDERGKYELFLRYFISAVKFARDELGYQQPLKNFINDIKKDVLFKFNKSLRVELEKLISTKDAVKPEEVEALAEKHFANWSYINSPKTYDPNDMNIYGKIGKYCTVPIKKEYRIAVGIAIVAYIQDQIKLIATRYNKKRDLQIFIRVRQSWDE